MNCLDSPSRNKAKNALSLAKSISPELARAKIGKFLFVWEKRDNSFKKLSEKSPYRDIIATFAARKQICLGHDDIRIEQSMDLPARTDALAERARMVSGKTLRVGITGIC